MKTIGFPISLKENENRRVILPEHIKLLSNPNNLYFEKGYGEPLGISDEEYLSAGSNVVSRSETLNQQIICDPKVGDAEYLEDLESEQIIFGWVHATQNKDITDKIVNQNLTAYAWEEMFYKGKHIFWENNVLAGEAAVFHAFMEYGKMPCNSKVAVIGRGNTARGAIKILDKLGAEVFQYNRRTEELLREEVGEYDVIVNCILWDVTRKDHIIYKDDLKRMKFNSMIIDVSCDENGGIETSKPTTIDNPTYIIDDVLHYVVDHTPSLFHKDFTAGVSKIIYTYLEQLMNDTLGDVLKESLIIDRGDIIDEEINLFQNRE